MLSRLGSGCAAIIATHDTRERTQSGKEKRRPNEQGSAERRDYFQRFCVAVVPLENSAAIRSFSLRAGPDSFQNGPKSSFGRPAADTPSGGSVQNILKKVKKRLVSPLEPR